MNIPNIIEKTLCESCGKWAIKQSTGIVYASYPAQYPMEYKCLCGWKKPAETVIGKTNEDIFKQQWENAQNN